MCRLLRTTTGQIWRKQLLQDLVLLTGVWRLPSLVLRRRTDKLQGFMAGNEMEVCRCWWAELHFLEFICRRLFKSTFLCLFLDAGSLRWLFFCYNMIRVLDLDLCYWDQECLDCFALLLNFRLYGALAWKLHFYFFIVHSTEKNEK